MPKLLRSKTLVIVRHAHRDKSQGREVDNGLSEKGKKQAQEVLKFAKKHFPRCEITLLSSPKKRCVQTLRPIAKWKGISIHHNDALGECGEREGVKHFRDRTRAFHKWWVSQGPEITFACTHGDWVPAFYFSNFKKIQYLKKGAWTILGVTEQSPLKDRSSSHSAARAN